MPVRDNRGHVPNYIVDDDAEGRVVVVHQPTGMSERVGELRPYSVAELRSAWAKLCRRVRSLQ